MKEQLESVMNELKRRDKEKEEYKLDINNNSRLLDQLQSVMKEVHDIKLQQQHDN